MSRYKVSRKKRPRIPCKNCGKEAEYFFCSISCRGRFQRKQKIERFKAGELTKGGLTLDIVLEVLERKCDCCQLSEWRNQPIPLDIDHIDGDHHNNEFKNIRLLCPNCHRQTGTWGNSKFQRMKKITLG